MDDVSGFCWDLVATRSFGVVTLSGTYHTYKPVTYVASGVVILGTTWTTYLRAILTPPDTCTDFADGYEHFTYGQRHQTGGELIYCDGYAQGGMDFSGNWYEGPCPFAVPPR
jgi:hypothetical protein